MVRVSRRIVFVAAVLACRPAEPTTPPPDAARAAPTQTEQQLGEPGKSAALAIDPARCEDPEARLRPFVISWDVTEQTEFTAHGANSLIAVALDGCEIELVPTCRVPGTYTYFDTSGGYQELLLDSVDTLVGKLAFSASRIGSSIERSSLVLRYFVRGMRRATAPMLYRAGLPAGCEAATHFVLNYAAGAYELASSASATKAGDAQSAGVVFRGGQMDDCEAGGERCGAPVRLRLLEIAAGGPPPADAATYAASLTAPVAGTAPIKLGKDDVRRVMRTSQHGVLQCHRRLTDPPPKIAFDTKFTIAPTGVVTQVEINRAPDPEFASCMSDVLYGLRFPAGTMTVKVSYPYVIDLGPRPAAGE